MMKVSKRTLIYMFFLYTWLPAHAIYALIPGGYKLLLYLRLFTSVYILISHRSYHLDKQILNITLPLKNSRRNAIIIIQHNLYAVNLFFVKNLTVIRISSEVISITLANLVSCFIIRNCIGVLPLA